MALPIEFQLAFGIYRVGLEVNALRLKVWALIESSLGPALDEHFREAIANAPSFREALTKNVAPYKDSIIKGTERLFTRPFDDSWAEARPTASRPRLRWASTCALGLPSPIQSNAPSVRPWPGSGSAAVVRCA